MYKFCLRGGEAETQRNSVVLLESRPSIGTGFQSVLTPVPEPCPLLSSVLLFRLQVPTPFKLFENYWYIYGISSFFGYNIQIIQGESSSWYCWRLQCIFSKQNLPKQGLALITFIEKRENWVITSFVRLLESLALIPSQSVPAMLGLIHLCEVISYDALSAVINSSRYSALLWNLNIESQYTQFNSSSCHLWKGQTVIW